MKIYKTNGAKLPEYATADAAGLDLTSAWCVSLPKSVRTLVNTGIHVEIPKGYFGMLVPRSSLSKKYIFLTNSVGIIDADYRGEIMASVIYSPPTDGAWWSDYGMIEQGERIVQLVIVPYAKVELQVVSSLDQLESTDRGSGGFGSTGS